jgi:hypothetical protein
MMLTQMQDQIAARDLTVERGAWIEAVIPIDRKAKEALIEFICLVDVEDAQNWDHPIEADFHDIQLLPTTAHRDAAQSTTGFPIRKRDPKASATIHSEATVDTLARQRVALL